MAKKLPIFFLIIAGLCSIAIVCHGRIFLRRGSRAQSFRAMETAGGKIAYQATVNLNRGRGQLTVFNFDKAIGDVVRELGQVFNSDDFNYSGGTMASATISSNDQVLRLMAIRLNDYKQTLVFKFAQSPSEFKVSCKPPTYHLMKTIPAYPGSEPVFFAKDENTRMSMAVSRTQSAPGGVREFFEARLAASGWTPALSPAKRGSTQGMTVYLRGPEICCVFVDSSAIPGECRITLLHKQQGIE